MIRTQLVIVTLLVALAAGVLIWLVVTPGSDAPPKAGPDAEAAPGPTAAAAPDRAPEKPVPGGESAPDAKPPAAPRVPSAPGDPAPVPSHRVGPRLIVVDGETGEPAAGARVRFLVPSRIPTPWRRVYFAGALSTHAALERFGSERTTSPDGAVTLPPFLTVTVVDGRRGDCWDRRRLSQEHPPADGVWRLALQPIRHLRVRVVDGDGKPVSDVRLQLDVANDLEGQFFGRRAPSGVTGEGGLARIRIPPALIAHTRAGHALRVEVDAPGLRNVDAPVTLDGPSREPVRLVLPPTGGVKVRVLDPSGAPAPDPTVVRIGGANTRGVLARDGIASFPHLRLGIPLRVEAVRPHWPVARTDGRAPEDPGEEVTIELAFAGAAGWIRGRVVRPDGTFDPDWRRLRVLLKRGPDAPILRRFGEPDGDGRFRVSRGRPGRGAGKRWVQVQALDWRGIRAESAWREVAFPEKGDVAVGDIPLVPAPLWASGRVVHGEGGPVPWVEVQVSYPKMFHRQVLPTERATVRGKSSMWSRAYHTRTDADGRFEVRGPLPTGPIRLEFRKPRHVQAALPNVRPGTSGIQVKMPRMAGLKGKVVVPEGLAPEWVSLLARRRQDQMEFLTFTGSNGIFQNERLLPGLYDVYVHVAGIDEPVLRIEGLQLRGGETAKDRRLERIDLRGRVRPVTISVVDPDRRPLPSASCTLLADRFDIARATPYGYYTVEIPVDGEGRTLLWTGAAGLDVEVRAPGYGWKWLSGVTSNRTVQLERGLAVRLLYGGTGELPEHAVVLAHVVLEEEAENVSAAYGWPDAVVTVLSHPTARTTLHVPIPGRYMVQISLRDQRKGPEAKKLAASLPHVILCEQEILVRDVKAPQDFTIRVTREEMLEGVEEFIDWFKDR